MPSCEALEASGSASDQTGWQPFHLVVEDGARLVAAAPLYVKSHSYGEYVFDHGWAEGYRRAGGSYYPKLLAAVPFTPVPGPRLLAAGAEAAPSADREPEGGDCASSGCPRCTSTSAPPTRPQALGAAGFLAAARHPVPLAERGLCRFDAWLGQPEERQAQDGAQGARAGARRRRHHRGRAWDGGDRGAARRVLPVLSRHRRQALGQRLPQPRLLPSPGPSDAARPGGADGGPARGPDGRRGPQLARHRDLYGRQWGCLEEFKFLHFEACYYQAIEFAIRHGLQRVEAGAQGVHKLHRGYAPVWTHSAHLIADPGFHEAVARSLAAENRAQDAEMAALQAALPYRNEA